MLEYFRDAELDTRPLWASQGRVIEGNPSLTVDEAWRSGWLGGEVNGVSIDSIQASSGGGDVIIVRSESFTVDDYEFRVFVESLFTDLTSLGRATI